MRRSIAPLVGALALLITTVPAARAAVGGFEGGDGNHACEGGVDWACVTQSAGWQLSWGSDATGPADDIFASSAKEDEPDGWTFQAAGTNNKTDLLTIWSATSEAGGAANMALAFRVATGGATASVSFELNQKRTQWRNKAGREIPCRSDGDVLVAYTLPADVQLSRWDGYGGPESCPDGAKGTWTKLTVPKTAFDAGVNGAPIASTLPPVPATLAASTFGETALDLRAIASAAKITRPCEFFAGMHAHSRQSGSDRSSMADYVAPARIAIAACLPPDPDGDDTKAPDPPTIAAGTDDACATTRVVRLAGTSEAGSQVQVRDGDTTAGLAEADPETGAWSLTLTDVPDGAHTYTAVARDAAGNVSDASAPATVKVDGTAPAAPVVLTPAATAPLAAGSVTLTGTAEPGTTVRIREGEVLLASTVTGPDGRWRATLAGVAAGTRTYAVTASDACLTSAAAGVVYVVAAPSTDPPGGDGTDHGSGPGPGRDGRTPTGPRKPAEVEVHDDRAMACARKPFTLRIPAKGLRKAVFRVDGRRVKVTTRRVKGHFTVRLDPRRFGVGTHKVSVRVTRRNGRTRVLPMRSFRRCAVGQCVSRRVFRVHVRPVRGDRVVRARVYVAGKRVAVTQGRRLSAGINLRGLPRGRVTVRIVAFTEKGRRIVDVRHYRTCTKKSPRR